MERGGTRQQFRKQKPYRLGGGFKSEHLCMREHATQLGGRYKTHTLQGNKLVCVNESEGEEKIIHRRVAFRSEHISMGGGDHTELFQWQGAQLYLIDGDDRALMQRGVFTLFLAQHSRSPQLVAVEATVGDVQWPVGKDSVVTCFTADKSRFSFALPGLVYELVLDLQDAVGGGEQIDRLETLLRLYTTFHLGAAGSKGGSTKDLDEAAERYWTSMTGRAQGDQAVEEEEEASEEEAALQLTLAAGHSGGNCTVGCTGVSRRMMKRMQQARRVSAVAKLFSKALVRGAIRAASHVDVAGGGGGGAEAAPAVAKVEAVARVVEAVERKWTSSDEEGNPGNIVGISDSGCWTLNEPGLHLLLKAVIVANSASASAASYLTSRHSTSPLAQLPSQLLCDSSTMPPTSPHVASHPESFKW